MQASSYEVLILRHTLDSCRDDPQTVEMNFMQVSGSLRRQMERGEYPESPELTGLANTLTQGALDIRATHIEVAEARAKRAEQAVREADPAKKAALAEALPVLVAVSNSKLATEFAQDMAQLLNTSVGPRPEGAPSVGPADATMRIGHRVAQMSLLAHSSEIAKKIDGSGGYKAVKIIGTISGLIVIIAALLGYSI